MNNNNSDCLSELIELNFLPIRYIHDSWFDQVEHGELVKTLRSHKKSENALSDYILAYFDIKDKMCFELSDFESRLAFLPPSDLMKLVRYAGVCANTESLRHCISGHLVRDIESALGKEVYLFGLRRAPYIMQSMPVRKVVYFNSEQIGEDIISSGMQCLALAVADFDPAITQRILFKLPFAWTKYFTKVESSSGDVVQLFGQLYQEVA